MYVYIYIYIYIGRDLFKLDTIGDAYILVGWLPKEEEEEEEEEDVHIRVHGAGVQGAGDEARARHSIENQQAVERTCSNVLQVAEAMLGAHSVKVCALMYLLCDVTVC